MRPVIFILAALVSITMPMLSYPQARAIKSVGKRTTKYVEKKLLKKTSEKAIIMAAEKTSVKYGKHFAGKSIMEGAVKKAARAKVRKLIKEEGAKTFLSYGLKKADNVVAVTRKSGVKRTFATSARHKAMRKEQKQATQKANSTGVKSVTKKALRLEGKAAAEHLIRQRPDLAPIIKHLESFKLKDGSNPMLDKLIVIDNGSEIKLSIGGQWANSEITVIGDKIIGKSGGLPNAGSSGLNEFFNVLLPNKTYVVDGCCNVKTDEYGRISEVFANRTKLANQKVKPRNGEQQRYIKNKKGGKPDDQGGHLISLNSGGSNESTNIVPMPGKWQANGPWRRFEEREEKAIAKAKKNGDVVESKRRLLYKGKSQRPYGIEVTLIINGKIVEGPAVMLFPT